MIQYGISTTGESILWYNLMLEYSSDFSMNDSDIFLFSINQILGHSWSTILFIWLFCNTWHCCRCIACGHHETAKDINWTWLEGPEASGSGFHNDPNYLVSFYSGSFLYRNGRWWNSFLKYLLHHDVAQSFLFWDIPVLSFSDNECKYTMKNYLVTKENVLFHCELSNRLFTIFSCIYSSTKLG